MTARIALSVGAVITALVSRGVSEPAAGDKGPLLDLRGKWKFEVGDDLRRAEPGFDDSRWEEIFVPAPWEDEGFPGYDGYAWYRKRITVPKSWSDRPLLLNLGNIDDVDEVYLNGIFIGFSGQFPPKYLTAYSVDREYPIPTGVLKFGQENVIAVRVYDEELSGGIIRGKPGIYERTDWLTPDVAITAGWKIRKGDDPSWRESNLDETGWQSVNVPAPWETQGLKGYDGFAWYRVHLRVPSQLMQQKLILLMGRIDDLDETYVNGERIGRTGSFPSFKSTLPSLQGDEYLQFRAYTVPQGLLKGDADNVIAVRVYDSIVHGGICDGPLGFVTRDRFLRWKPHANEEKKGFWRVLEYLFQ